MSPIQPICEGFRGTEERLRSHLVDGAQHDAHVSSQLLLDSAAPAD